MKMFYLFMPRADIPNIISNDQFQAGKIKGSLFHTQLRVGLFSQIFSLAMENPKFHYIYT